MADGEGAEGATEQTGEAGQTALTGADTTATEGAKSAESDAKTATDTKELGLTQEQAQKLVDFQASMLRQQQEQFAEQVSNWAAEAKADNEIGGKSFDDNLSLARKGLEYVGTPELREALDSTGMGNHPEVIRAFYRIGKQLGEGSFEQGRGPSSQPKTAAEVLYPSMYKEG